MIEIHGWITLRYSDYHSEEHLQRDFIYNFKSYLNKAYSGVLSEPYCKFTNYNGLECFSINVQHNHRGDAFYLTKIFSWVAEHSDGSYGLLYFHDEEDESSFNEFQVYVLKRGTFTKAKDVLLSPYWEEVEKEYDANDPPRD